MMDRFFAPHTPEARAHFHLTDNYWWDTDLPTIDESLVAGCAAYRAFSRYLTGSDLFLKPRNKRDLESVLRRYAYDAIHNTIATARSQVRPGGYSRLCALAEMSIRQVLIDKDNAATLLALHGSSHVSSSTPREVSVTRGIRIN